MLNILPPIKSAVKLQVNTAKSENVPVHLSRRAGIIEAYGIEVFMCELGRVADRLVPKKIHPRAKIFKSPMRAYFFVATRPFLNRAEPAGIYYIKIKI